MEEKLQTALAEIINLTLQGKDFVLEQAPDVISQLLAWKFTISLLGFLCFIPLVIGAILFIKMSIKECRKDYHSQSEVAIAGGCVAGIICSLATPIAFFANTVWLQILIAPKVYLLEYAAQLVG